MLYGSKKLKLTDLIDIEFLQDIQDVFAQTMDFGCIIIDEDGPITQPSNFTEFCTKYIRSNPKGLERCIGTDIKWGKIAGEKKEPVIYKCHAGLTDFIVPIVVDGEHIASILGGQVLTEEVDESKARVIANFLAIDENEYIEAVKKIRIVPLELIQRAADLFSKIANTISDISHKNLELRIKNKRDELYKNVVETIRSSLNINETKQKIVNIVGQTLNADRCLIIDYDKDKDEFLPVQDEYLSSDQISGYKGVNINVELPKLAAAVKEGKSIIINDKKITLGDSHQNFETEKKTIDRYRVNSAYAVPLYYFNELLGVLSMHFVRPHKVGEEDISLVSMIADQIAIAIYQAKLYNAMKISAEREKLIASIIAKSISNFDISSIKEIVKDVGILTKADRCFFVEVDLKEMKGKPVDSNGEYLSSPEIESIVGYELLPKDVGEFIYLHLETKDILVFDFEKMRQEQDKKHAGINRYSALFNLKSGIEIPFFYGDKLMASLSIEYINEKVFPSEDELNFLRILANQVGIAYYQIQLYQDIKKTAERESLYHEIIGTIRSSLNIVETKQKIVNIIGKTLEADRCFITEYDNVNQRYLIVKDEYKSSADIPGYAGSDANHDVPNFINEIKNGNSLIIDDKKIYISGKLKEYEKERSAIEKFMVHSAYAFPIFYKEEYLGILAIHYLDSKHSINDEDIALMESLADQISIAIYQSKLFETTQKQVKRETLLRNITESIRSSLDIEKTLEYICYETSKLFNAQRTTIAALLDPNDPSNYKVMKESRVNSEIKGLNEAGDYSGAAIYLWESLMHKTNTLVLDNIELSDAPEVFKETYKAIGVKSIIAVAIRKGEDLWGTLALSHYDDYKHWSEDEIHLLETISNQIYIAIKQAELYKTTQMNAERERLLRTIIENIRSTLDLDKILEYICEEITNLFKVQRTTIVSLPESEDFSYYNVRKEYKTSPDIKGLSVAADFSEASRYWWNSIINFTNALAFDNVEESNAPAGFKKAYKEIGVKSIISTAIKKEKKVWGCLVLSEYDKPRHWTNEEIDLLNAIADQIYIAINQAELYEKQKEAAQREKLLKDIILTIRSTLDFDEIKKIIVTEIGKAFHADRVFIIEHDIATGTQAVLDKYSEYLASPDEISHIGFDFSGPEVEFLQKMHKKTSTLYIEDISEFLEENNLQDSVLANWLLKSNVKSTLGMAIVYADKVYGDIIMEYTKSKAHFTEDQIKFFRTLADQIGIAIYQSKLFEKEKRTAEREIALRETIKVLRSTLDSDVIKKYFVEIASKYFDADRCLFIEYNKQTNEFLPFRIEKLKSSQIQSLLGIDPEKNFPEFTKRIKKGKNIIIRDLESSLSRKNVKNYKALETLAKVGVKSDYALQVQYKDTIMGILVLHFVGKKRVLRTNEFNFLKALKDQAGIALYQAELYQNTRETAERETLLRQVFETLRSSLDINIIKNKMVSEVGKALNADRCFILSYEPSEDNFFIDEYSEYLAPKEEKSFIGFNARDPKVKFFIDAFRKHQEVDFYNVDDYIEKKQLYGTLEEGFLREYSIKSAYNISIYYANNLLGYVILHYTSDYRALSESDLEFLRLVAVQTGIAMHQANLYKITKLQAEREKISRNIIEIIRSTLDKKTMKHLFVRTLGTYFQANRVSFSEYDQSKGMYLPVDKDSEYLSSSLEKSFVNYDWSNNSIREYVQPLLEKRELNIYSLDQYVDEYHKSPEFKSIFLDADVKSSYNLPILYQQRLMGFFCIEFTHKVTKLSEDDINLVRSISRQAGIALYQDELYSKAQESAHKKSEYITNTSIKIKETLNNIIAISDSLLKSGKEDDKQMENFNAINNLGKDLLELMNEIS